MEDSDYTDDHRPRVWRALDEIQKENIVFREKLRVIEEAFSRHLAFHDGMQSGMESIHAKLSSNSVILAELKAGLEEQKKEVKSLWDFPRNSLTIIGLLSGAALGIYKFWTWAIHAIEVRTK